MRKGGGIEKGSSYERAIGEILTKAFYPDGGGIFQRVYAHPISKKGEVKSDLIALKYIQDPTSNETALILDRSFPFSVECKNYKGVKPIFSGLYAKDSEIWDWMTQAENAAKGKMPVLIFRLFRTKDLVMISAQTMSSLNSLFGHFDHPFFLMSKRTPEMEMERAVYLLVLTDFLNWIDFGVFRLTDPSKFIRSMAPKEEENGQ